MSLCHKYEKVEVIIKKLMGARAQTHGMFTL